MLKSLVNVLVTPLNDAEEQAHMAIALNTVLYAMTIVWTVVVGVYSIAWHGPGTVRIGVAFIAFLVLCIVLVRKRRMLLPRLAVPAVLLMAVTYLAAADLGLHDNVLVALPLVILMGALFTGKRGGVAYLLLAIAAIGYLCYAEIHGPIKEFTTANTGITDFFDITIILCAVAALLWALISSISNVSNRARTSQLKTAEAYARLSKAQRMAHIGSWELDLKTELFNFGDERGDEVARILEIDPKNDVLSYESFLQMVHANDRENVAAVIANAREDKRVFDTEFRLLMKDERIKWIHAQGEILFGNDGIPLRSLGAVQDITAFKRAHEAMQSSEERYRALFEAAGDAIFILQGEICIRCNPKALELFGCDESDLLGRALYEFSTPTQPDGRNSRELADEKIAAAFNGRVQMFEWMHSRCNGMPFPSEVTLSPLRLHDEVFVQAIVRDVTERKHEEAERQKLEAQLVQAQKMESVGRLAGGVAHDFNNLLTAIVGYADMAAIDSRKSDPAVHEAVLQIRAAGERASELTRQLLAFARKQTLEVRVFDVNEMIRGFSTMLKRLIGEDVKFVTELSNAAVHVKADMSQIHQVLLNLVVNARDAMPKGGMLKIETSSTTIDAHYVDSHPDAKPGEFVTVCVSDTGIGMDDETLKQAFEPFYTTKEMGKGTGLGLSMVYGIVKQHGGHVSVYSELGRGTTFRIYLPLAEEAAHSETAQSNSPAVSGGNETILLVEDDAVVRRLAFSMLTSLGYDVIEAKSARDATQIALRKKSIHLLLTDVIMPDLSGRAVYAQVSALHPETNVLYMSGYTGDIITHHGILDKDARLLQKPFTQATLSQKVREALAGNEISHYAMEASRQSN
jgi:two-component system cell cycle sensor histidine kinase/response regulator CckA